MIYTVYVYIFIHIYLVYMYENMRVSYHKKMIFSFHLWGFFFFFSNALYNKFQFGLSHRSFAI